jgi:hypothetical protein
MKRRTKIAIGTSIGLAAALLIAWPISAAAESHAIVVTTDAKPFVCTNPADITTVHFQSRYAPAIRLNADVNCTIRIRVYNDGILPAEITSERFNILGRDAPTAYVYLVDGRPSHESHDDPFGNSDDAVGELQEIRELAPGGVTIVTAQVKLSRDECVSDGGFGLFQNEPELGVTVLGISVPRTPTDVNLGFVGTKQATSVDCEKALSDPTGN